MTDPALTSNAPGERGPFIPQTEFEQKHAAKIREKMAASLTRSQAILAVRQQLEYDASKGQPVRENDLGASNLGSRDFVAEDAFAVKHAAAIRERMRGGLTQAQAVQCVRDQIAEDAR